jgi:hypothetical protein
MNRKNTAAIAPDEPENNEQSEQQEAPDNVVKDAFASSKAPPTKPYDPFAEENIQLPQDVLDEAVSHTELTIIPVIKPHPQHFIRVHPDPAYQHVAAIIELDEERGANYLIHPTCLLAVKEYGIPFRFQQLFFYVNTQETYFFWPIKMPNSDRDNRWLDTARETVEKARRKWVWVRSNMKLGGYESQPAIDNDKMPEPEWPQKNGTPLTKNELLKKAFRERLIMDIEHPVIRKLRGAILK